MFSPDEVPELRQTIRDATARDRRLLDDLREEIRALASSVRPIKPRSTTSVSLVASDGGNNKLIFDPFHVQLVRVVDSYGEQLCLDAVTPSTDTDVLSRAQFESDGSTPRTALGRVMADLGVEPLLLNRLSHMIPEGKKVRETPDEVSPSWVLVYRDLCEWAALYERICHRSFATDTLLVRDGLLRSKLFRGEYFIDLRKRIEEAIARIQNQHHRKVLLVGVAKHSKVLERYRLAMALEGTFPVGAPRYLKVPRALEAKAYVWPEYARGAETEGAGEAPKFVAGDMYFARFGERGGDPVWTVDLLSSQASNDAEVFGYLLADAINGFPVPFYPRCLQRAHEFAEIVDFDLEILQDEVVAAVRDLLSGKEVPALDALQFQGDVSGRRYE